MQLISTHTESAFNLKSVNSGDKAMAQSLSAGAVT